MSDQLGTGPATLLPEQILAARSGIAALREIVPSALTADQLAASLLELENQLRRISADAARLLGEFDARECGREVSGARTTATWLQAELSLSQTEARSRARLARRHFGQPPVVLGGERRSLLPETTADWLSGRLSQAHVRVVDAVVSELDREIDRHVPDDFEAGERRAAVESLVLDVARQCDPDTLRQRLSNLRAQLVPEAIADAEDVMWASRRVNRYALMDGMQSLDGMLTPEAAALADVVLGYFGRLGVVGDEDARSNPQREHDGFVNALRALVEGGFVPSPEPDETDVAETGAQASGDQRVTDALAQIPVAAGNLAHLSVIVDVEALQEQGGLAELLGGGAFDGATARAFACDSDISLILKSETTLLGEINYRVAIGPLKRMVMIRDRGRCRFPGCCAPIRHIHHLKPWAQGGRTRRKNLVGLCWFHHDLVHHEGWQLVGDPDTGPLTAIPPDLEASYLDRRTARHRRARPRYLRTKKRALATR